MTTELLASIANTIGVVVVVAALATLVVGLLERTHRRESGLGHAPFGADLGASADRDRVRDRDTLRVLDELRAAADRDAASDAYPLDVDPVRFLPHDHRRPPAALGLSTGGPPGRTAIAHPFVEVGDRRLCHRLAACRARTSPRSSRTRGTGSWSAACVVGAGRTGSSGTWATARRRSSGSSGGSCSAGRATRAGTATSRTPPTAGCARRSCATGAGARSSRRRPWASPSR